MSEPITLRGLNRATLARQMLLERQSIAPIRAVEHFVGLQAQEARPPFLGLWSRLKDFRREDLIALVESRKVVRVTAMRCTLHLMSSADYRSMRAVIQPALCAAMRSIFRDSINTLKVKAVVARAEKLLAKTPQTFEELRDALAKLDPQTDVRAMGYAVRTHVPLVQVPIAGAAWAYSPTGQFGLAEEWMKKKIARKGDLDGLTLRYLAAFGPATPKDAASWSGISEMAESFERLRPRLKVFTDEKRREYFDLPDAPRPSDGVTAPVRFLPDFDVSTLGYFDKTRLVPEKHRAKLATKNLRVLATFLVDGFVAGAWKIQRKGKQANLSISPFESISKAVRRELEQEGESLLRFAEPDASRFEIQFGKT